MVNTPPHTDARANSRGTPNAAYRAKIDQMQKDLDALHQSNAALRLQISEGEGQSSQNKQHGNQEGNSEQRRVNQDARHRKGRSIVKKLQELMAALEKKCDLMQ